MRTSCSIGSVSCLCLLLVALLQPVAAQTGAGTVQGTVKDQSGAIIAGAKVRVMHSATSEARDTTTNTAGFYTFPQVPIGRYQMTVQSSGMMTWTAPLDVITGQTA